VPALVLFAFGLALRLWFATATPDGGNGWHVGFQGDAPIWQDHAARLAHGLSDGRDVLPLRPPGMPWLIALLWDGEGASAFGVRWLFAILGALVAPLLWLGLRRRLDPVIAFTAALFTAAASNLLLLASGPHVETLYLTVVLGSLLVQERLAGARGSAWALAWGALHGALCLLRAEHVLVAAAFLVLAWRAGANVRTLLLGGLATAAVLVPWQLHANRLVTAYNDAPVALPPSVVPWDDAARAGAEAWPAFARPWLFAFVGDTVKKRGGAVVTADDLAIVHEAFGVRPERLRPGLVTLQGPLDFWLANTPEADGAFSRRALDRPPPLLGGADRYAADLAQRLPRDREFSFRHPMHVHAMVHGYSLGFAELAADPWGAAGRIAAKMWHAAEGATGGLSGYALPIGLSGERRPVDFVTATGAWSNAWRALLLVVAAIGLWRLRGEQALHPLLVFAGLRLVTVAAFFGYARQGALCLPVVAIGAAAVVAPLLRRALGERALRIAAIGFIASCLGIEAVRARSAAVEVDGRAWTQPAGGEPDWNAHSLVFR